ncbi:MAG: class I SAM-dependent methyltransferase [Lachnospiraceae bacterium]|nr:class I SAM-dependent methyltransferase [Lachnospiraceae bacterium]
MVELSKRLSCIASMITPGNVLCDVGTDHGYLPIAAVLSKRCPRALAMDVAQGPLEKAKNNIKKEQCEGLIETRRSNGLMEFHPSEADTVVIAGMGGMLMLEILQASLEKLHQVKELILSPQLDMDQVRRFLIRHDFIIDGEAMIWEDEKYYMIFHVISGKEACPYTEEEYWYGRHLLAAKDQVLYAYLLREKELLTHVQENLAHQENTPAITLRKEEIIVQLEYIAKALRYFQ